MDTKETPGEKKDAVVKNDPKTLNTPDPQEEMEGPVSSLVQGAKENVEKKAESKAEADQKKEENM
ncbi:MAG: hypothetical protein EOO03_06555 [Chitinophagaceae bacterium]|nr:MAG: hypothetical protein EOO03_06555 [Chitinophagaceae bacterium]